MENITITDMIKYIGTDDKDIDLFESQYRVPNGISYNSYVILDEKIAVLDTVDIRKTEEWKENLERVLDGRKPDFLIISHMEPDHAANIHLFMEMYPDAKLVASVKGVAMLSQFFDKIDFSDRTISVKEGDVLSLGKHKLQFIMAPMIHWPEVMMEYEQTEKILFSADAFGKFGALDVNEGWTPEAMRYYFNIVGRYGTQVQALLKKAANLDIQMICPLHGPMIKEHLEYYLKKYDKWSRYEAENPGVMIAYASIHGNTKRAAEKMKEILLKEGAIEVALADLAREDMSKVIAHAFCYDKIILAASSYDGSVFPPMASFLEKLVNKNFQNKKIALIENSSWAPSAERVMNEYVGKMKNIHLCETVVRIRSVMKESDIKEMEVMAEEMLK